MSSPFETFGLDDTCTVDDLKRKWREMASELHPDRGGDGELFITRRKDYYKALEILMRPVKCDICGGDGKESIRNGFNAIKMRCKKCNGQGTLQRGS